MQAEMCKLPGNVGHDVYMFTSSLSVEFICVIYHDFKLNSTRLELCESRSTQGRYEKVTQNLTHWVLKVEVTTSTKRLCQHSVTSQETRN